jgi:NAD(P)-dependent dehydrogenase (short-subunit alcohol dehydrogenase family)
VVRVQQLFDLSGRVALVTGGSRGLGLEMAEGLGEAGAKVVVTARRPTWLESAKEMLAAAGVDALALPCDITDAAQVDAMCRTVESQFGPIDILVNNAGVNWAAPAAEMPLERWRQVIETNLTGTFVVTQAVGRTMIARRTGKVINTASIAGLIGAPPEVLDAIGYSASKGGVIAFTRDLAVKWARHGITVNAIAPGFFLTRLTEGLLQRAETDIAARTPLGRIGKPGELKGVTVFLASPAADYITGQVIAVDGGATAE